MANPSIYAAFERMWQHIVAALGSKANKEEIDAKIDELTEIFVQETEPENPEVGDIWVDTSVGAVIEAQPLSILQGGTGANTAEEARANLEAAPAFSSGATILTSFQYGDELPTEATLGRVFFKKA